MASGGRDRDAEDALSKLLQMGEAFSFARATEARFTDLQLWKLLRSNPTTLGEAFFKARIIEARFKDERSTTAIAKATDLNTGVHVQDLELETKVLVDGKQDDAKVVKVVGVAGYQNSDEPNVLKGNRVIGIGVNENNKGVDKEVQYSVYTLHVLIPFLKHLSDKSNPTTLGVRKSNRARFLPAKCLDETLNNSSLGYCLGEAFSLARITDACFEDQRSSSLSNKTSSNNGELQNQNLAKSRFTMPRQEPIDEVVFVKVNDEMKGFSLEEIIEEKNAFNLLQVVQQAIDVESTSNNDARDQTSELETKGLVDGNQDDAKVVCG
nr:harbinger transposase-derived nuclease domain-containing protein [Tanacetum cinerariifolium]